MKNSSQSKRVRSQRYIFLLACLASLLGLAFYIFGRNQIPFPTKGMPNINKVENAAEIKSSKLFFSGINMHLQINFILQLFFMLINSLGKIDEFKVKKWRYGISKGLIFIGSLFTGLSTFGEAVGTDKGSNILLLCLIVTVINCCLLELLIQLMNQYGICNAFNLILFAEFLPLEGLRSQGNQQKILDLFILFIVTIFFVWITNLKGEAPIDTNTLYSQESKVLKRKPSKLGFKLSFSFMPLIYLSQFISFIHNLAFMKGETDGFSFSSIFAKGNEAETEKKKLNLSNLNTKNSFGSSLFILNESKRVFQGENIAKGFQEKGGIVIAALFFLILLRGLVVWLQMRQSQGETGKISKELQGRGIYIDHVPPARSTSNLLKIVINKLVFLGNVVILVFNFVFDNLFSSLLSFSNGFGGVNIGVDLIKQIRTKYRYIQNK